MATRVRFQEDFPQIAFVSKPDLFFVLGIALIFMLTGCGGGGIIVPLEEPQPLPIEVKEYHIDIVPVDESLDILKVRERLVFTENKETILFHSGYSEILRGNKAEFLLPEKQVDSMARGLVLREVNIVPFVFDDTLEFSDGTLISGDFRREMVLTFTNGITVTGAINLLDTEVRLVDFPKGTFFEAKNARDKRIETYLDTETIVWSAGEAAHDIKFAYIPPPYNHIRPVLESFVEVFSFNQLVLVLLGLIMTMYVTPIVKPVIVDRFKEKFKAKILPELDQKHDEIVNLIVSSDGQEKEVKVKKNRQKKS
jgi:hypothetical protein